MKLILAALAATTMLAAIPAKADILATGARSGNYTNNTVSTDVLVPINGALTTVTFFTTVPNQLVRIVYNAECGALGNPGAWLSVKVKVDGIEAAPASGTLFAFCTATSKTSYSWTGAVRQSIYRVPQVGAHRVTVTGYGVSTTTWWLGDTSIVVDK